MLSFIKIPSLGTRSRTRDRCWRTTAGRTRTRDPKNNALRLLLLAKAQKVWGKKFWYTL